MAKLIARKILLVDDADWAVKDWLKKLQTNGVELNDDIDSIVTAAQKKLVKIKVTPHEFHVTSHLVQAEKAVAAHVYTACFLDQTIIGGKTNILAANLLLQQNGPKIFFISSSTTLQSQDVAGYTRKHNVDIDSIGPERLLKTGKPFAENQAYVFDMLALPIEPKPVTHAQKKPCTLLNSDIT